MNFDKSKLLKLTQELGTLQQREDEITAELAGMFGGKVSGTATADAGVKVKGKPGRKPKGFTGADKPEALQAVVLRTMESLRKPKSLFVIVEKIRTKRPQTTNASVASVLHQLAKRGKVIENADKTFYLPVADLPSTPAAAVSEVSDAVAPRVDPFASVVPSNATPQEVLEDA